MTLKNIDLGLAMENLIKVSEIKRYKRLAFL